MIKKSKLMTRILPLIALSALFVGCANTPKPITTHATKPKIALILGGGGAKGFAHVGVLEALETHNIKPDIIIGTSSGAMVGAMYASGKSAQELRQIALHLDENELIDITPSKQGLIEGEKLAKFINTQVNFTPRKTPLAFCASCHQCTRASDNISDRRYRSGGACVCVRTKALYRPTPAQKSRSKIQRWRSVGSCASSVCQRSGGGRGHQRGRACPQSPHPTQNHPNCHHQSHKNRIFW